MKRVRKEKQLKSAGATATCFEKKQQQPAPPRNRDEQKEQPKQLRQPEGEHRDFWEHEKLLLREWPVMLTERERKGSGLRQVPVTTLRILEDPLGLFAAGNGATLWDCSLALARFLECRYCWQPASSSTSWHNKSVLELGSGLGLVSMALASLGATVTVTEREICLPILLRNLSENELLSSPVKGGGGIAGDGDRSANYGRCRVVPLTWGKDVQIPWVDDQNFDIIIGADLAFPSNSDNYDALADTFANALRGPTRPLATEAAATERRGVSEGWLAHEARRPEIEIAFWEALRNRGIIVERMLPFDEKIKGSSSEGNHELCLPPVSVVECQSREIGIYRLTLSPH